MMIARRYIFPLLVFLFALAFARGEEAPAPARFAGPPAGLLALPVYRMMETPGAMEVEFVPWRTPDQLRAIILSGQAGFVGMPTNVAANFNNRGAGVRMLNVAIWRGVWVVSSLEATPEMASLAGVEIVVPFKGELPALLFRHAVVRAGLDPEKDMSIRYVSTAQDAAQLLLSGKTHFAVLSEPWASLAITKPREDSGAPPLYRLIDVQEAASGGAMALAGVAVLDGQDARAQQFHDAYRRAAAWCAANPKEAGALMERHAEGMAGEAVEEALAAAALDAKPAAEVREELEAFFTLLLRDDPAKVGEKLPGDSFYWEPKPEAPGEPRVQESE